MIQNNSKCIKYLKKDSPDKMREEGPAAKRKPLQCITNSKLQEYKAKQNFNEKSLKKCETKLPKLSPSIIFTENGSYCDNQVTSNSAVDESSRDMCSDENIQPLDLTIMECNENLQEFYEDSIVLYSSDEDLENDIAFQNRLNDMICMVEYRDDMHKFLRETEILVRPKPNYMNKQVEITVKMRSIMVDWMVDVIEEFKHDRETLHLAVNYVDRFLSVMSVARAKLQLVGTTALWIAGKFEEIYPPGVKDYSYITDDTYTVDQVIRMEHLMLKVLEFEVAVPTACAFCERYIKENNVPTTTAHLARCLVDMSLLNSDPFLNYLPSEIAASAIYLANCATNRIYWTTALELSTKYAVADLKTCVYSLYMAYLEAVSSPYQAIRNKYISEKYESVAILTIPTLSMLQF